MLFFCFFCCCFFRIHSYLCICLYPPSPFQVVAAGQIGSLVALSGADYSWWCGQTRWCNPTTSCTALLKLCWCCLLFLECSHLCASMMPLFLVLDSMSISNVGWLGYHMRFSGWWLIWLCLKFWTAVHCHFKVQVVVTGGGFRLVCQNLLESCSSSV